MKIAALLCLVACLACGFHRPGGIGSRVFVVERSSGSLAVYDYQARQLLERRIIALPAGPNVIRMLPPLVVEKEQIDRVTAALREILA